MNRFVIIPVLVTLMATDIVDATGSPRQAQTARIEALTIVAEQVPRRLVGYGLVIGLEGTGDQSFSSFGGATHTVQSVANLLRRFAVEVPARQMRLRNVAAVLVTAEISRYLRAGGRFDVQVASLGDAVSLRGGVLWMTPLMDDVDQPPVATGQGPLLISEESADRFLARRGTSGRIPDGGLLEVDPEAVSAWSSPRLRLKRPNLGTAVQIAAAVNAAFGDGTATVEDPGAVRLNRQTQSADTLFAFLAAVDTLSVEHTPATRLIVDGRTGSVVIGGTLQVGPAVVVHGTITLAIGYDSLATAGTPAAGVVRAEQGATVQDIASALHAVGARPREIGAIFEALRDVGALTARVVIR